MIKPNFLKLVNLMNDRELSISDVAKTTEIDASMFTRWKNGDYYPKTDKLYKLAKFFGVPIEYFLED